ncbi:MAG: NepR family anti-sigma factor [Cypionkella sp.]
MKKPEKPTPLPKSPRSDKERALREPGWAAGLRKLYDNVVAEPLPDHFEALLKKLDQQ